MFDIGASELLVIVVIAVLVIGPKDMPMALRTVGRWMGKVRRVSNHFRTGVDAMIREAEMEEMEREWKERNAAIMADSPPPGKMTDDHGVQMEPLPVPHGSGAAAHGPGAAPHNPNAVAPELESEEEKPADTSAQSRADTAPSDTKRR